MNTMPRAGAPEPDESAGAAEVAAMRRVHRTASELRRGAPVVLEVGAARLILLAAETAEAAGLGEVLALAAGPPALLLARHRAEDLRAAASVGFSPAGPRSDLPIDFAPLAAFALPVERLEGALLRRLADPTLPQTAGLASVLSEVALPAGAEAAVHLAKIARLLPAVLVATLDAGHDAAKKDDLLAVAAEAIIAYPLALTTGLRRVAEAEVPLESAPDARVIAFRPLDGGVEHLAIVVGHPERESAPLVRVHSACLTGDLLGSLRCDCGPQLRAALARMNESGAGVLLYLAQEGRGIGLVNKLRAYAIQDRGQDTVDANLSLGWAVDERSFLAAAIMLEQLGLRRVRLLTNNPAKVAALTAHGIEVVAREPHVSAPNGVNDGYLRAKAERLGHLLG
jgi:GTP cyclohydrolase II